ncbi:zinc-ribbon domain protein [uncultured archaeon]|nr:zinc-ribbon domain protein [uncultured archaeon]
MPEEKGGTKYCSNCGAEIDAKAVVCPKCGVAQHKPDEKVSSLWYLVPLFFGFIGGIVAWAVNKDRNAPKARNMLIFGIIWTIIVVILFGVSFLAILASIFGGH